MAKEYLKNVLKSFKYTLPALGKDLLPSIDNNIAANKDFAKNVAGESRKIFNTGGTRYLFDKVISDEWKQMGSDLGKNLKDDLKSGKWFNNDRAKAQMDASINDFFKDIDLEGFEGLEDFDPFKEGASHSSSSSRTTGESDDGNDITNNNVFTNKNLVINNNVVSVPGQMRSDPGLRALAATNTAIGNKQVNVLGAVANGVAQLVEFNAKHSFAHFQNSTEFYQNTTDLLSQVVQGMNKLIEQQERMIGQGEDDLDIGVAGLVGDGVIDATSGAFKAGEYTAAVVKNFHGMMGSGMSNKLGLMLKNYVANPIGEAMKDGLKAIMPKDFKNSLQELDKVITGLPSAFVLKMNEWAEDSKNPFLKRLGKLLGVALDQGEIDFGAYKKGAIPFDGITKRAIVNVIPSLLGKILTAIQSQKTYDASRDGDHLIYDYDKGKFTKKSVLQDKIQKEMDGGANNNLKRHRETIMEAIRQSTPEAMKGNKAQMDRMMKAYENQLSKAFDHIVKRGKLYRGQLTGAEAGVSEDVMGMINSMFKGMTPGQKFQFTKDTIGAAQDKMNYIRRLNKDETSGRQVAMDVDDLNGTIHKITKSVAEMEKEFETATKELHAATLGISLDPKKLNYSNAEKAILDARKKKDLKSVAGSILKGNKGNAGAGIVGPAEIVEAAQREKGGLSGMLQKLKEFYRMPFDYAARGIDWFNHKMAKIFFGDEDNQTAFGKMINDVKAFFVGKKDEHGNVVKQGIFGKMADAFDKKILDPVRTKLFGKVNPETGKKDQKGLVDQMMDKITQAVIEPIKEKFNKTVAPYVKAVLMQLKTSILGTKDEKSGKWSGGFLSNMIQKANETWEGIKTKLFGKKGADGSWTEGIISKKTQGQLKKYGWGAGMGLVASIFFPGAPLVHATLGMLHQTEAVQKFLYDKNKGIFPKMKKGITNVWNRIDTYLFGEKDKDGSRKTAGKLTNMISMARTFWDDAKKKFSLFMFGNETAQTEFGKKGLVGWSKDQAKKIYESTKKFLFGEKDPDSKRRKGGLFGDLIQLGKDQIVTPFVNLVKKDWANIKKFWMNEIVNPLKQAFQPFIKEFQLQFEKFKKWGKDVFKNGLAAVKNTIDGLFKDAFGKSLTDMMTQYVLNPLKNTLKTIHDSIASIFKQILLFPINIVKKAAGELRERHRKLGMDYAQDDEQRGWFQRRRDARYRRDHASDVAAASVINDRSRGMSGMHADAAREDRLRRRDSYNEQALARSRERASMMRYNRAGYQSASYQMFADRNARQALIAMKVEEQRKKNAEKAVKDVTGQSSASVSAMGHEATMQVKQTEDLDAVKLNTGTMAETLKGIWGKIRSWNPRGSSGGSAGSAGGSGSRMSVSGRGGGRKGRNAAVVVGGAAKASGGGDVHGDFHVVHDHGGSGGSGSKGIGGGGSSTTVIGGSGHTIVNSASAATTDTILGAILKEVTETKGYTKDIYHLLLRQQKALMEASMKGGRGGRRMGGPLGMFFSIVLSPFKMAADLLHGAVKVVKTAAVEIIKLPFKALRVVMDGIVRVGGAVVKTLGHVANGIGRAIGGVFNLIGATLKVTLKGVERAGVFIIRAGIEIGKAAGHVALGILKIGGMAIRAVGDIAVTLGKASLAVGRAVGGLVVGLAKAAWAVTQFAINIGLATLQGIGKGIKWLGSKVIGMFTGRGSASKAKKRGKKDKCDCACIHEVLVYLRRIDHNIGMLTGRLVGHDAVHPGTVKAMVSGGGGEGHEAVSSGGATKAIQENKKSGTPGKRASAFSKIGKKLVGAARGLGTKLSSIQNGSFSALQNMQSQAVMRAMSMGHEEAQEALLMKIATNTDAMVTTGASGSGLWDILKKSWPLVLGALGGLWSFLRNPKKFIGDILGNINIGGKIAGEAGKALEHVAEAQIAKSAMDGAVGGRRRRKGAKAAENAAEQAAKREGEELAEDVAENAPLPSRNSKEGRANRRKAAKAAKKAGRVEKEVSEAEKLAKVGGKAARAGRVGEIVAGAAVAGEVASDAAPLIEGGAKAVGEGVKVAEDAVMKLADSPAKKVAMKGLLAGVKKLGVKGVGAALEAVPVVGNILGTALLIGSTAYDAYGAVKNTGKVFGVDQSKATFGMKASNVLATIGTLGFDNGTVAKKIHSAGQKAEDWIKQMAGAIETGVGNFFTTNPAGKFIYGTFLIMKDALGWVGKEFKAAWEGVTGWIGKEFKEGWNAVVGFAKDVGGWISGEFKKGWGVVTNFAQSVGDWIGNVFAQGWEDAKAIFQDMKGWLKTGFTWVQEGYNWVVNNISAAFNWMGGIYHKVTGWLHDKLMAGLNWVGNVFNNVGDWLGSHFQGVIKAVKWVAQPIMEGFAKVGNVIHDVMQPIFNVLHTAFNWLGQKFSPIVGAIKWLGNGIAEVLKKVTLGAIDIKGGKFDVVDAPLNVAKWTGGKALSAFKAWNSAADARVDAEIAKKKDAKMPSGGDLKMGPAFKPVDAKSKATAPADTTPSKSTFGSSSSAPSSSSSSSSGSGSSAVGKIGDGIASAASSMGSGASSIAKAVAPKIEAASIKAADVGKATLTKVAGGSSSDSGDSGVTTSGSVSMSGGSGGSDSGSNYSADSGSPFAGPVQTSPGQEAFVKAWAPGAVEAAARLGVPKNHMLNAVTFMLTQWGLESGWGSSAVSKRENNLGGIKYTPSLAAIGATPGSISPEGDRYAHFKDVAQWGAAYSYFLNTNGRYRGVITAMQNGAAPEQVASMMGKTGYATDPAYGSKLIGTMPGVKKALQGVNLALPAQSSSSSLFQNAIGGSSTGQDSTYLNAGYASGDAGAQGPTLQDYLSKVSQGGLSDLTDDGTALKYQNQTIRDTGTIGSVLGYNPSTFKSNLSNYQGQATSGTAQARGTASVTSNWAAILSATQGIDTQRGDGYSTANRGPSAANSGLLFQPQLYQGASAESPSTATASTWSTNAQRAADLAMNPGYSYSGSAGTSGASSASASGGTYGGPYDRIIELLESIDESGKAMVKKEYTVQIDSKGIKEAAEQMADAQDGGSGSSENIFTPLLNILSQANGGKNSGPSSNFGLSRNASRIAEGV